MAAESAALGEYFDELCRDADIILSGTPARCSSAGLIESDWRRVVQAGYNNIDKRCDAYLVGLSRSG
jgi:hypothetical protein